MVRCAAFLSAALAALLIIACGGDAGGAAPTRQAAATRPPSGPTAAVEPRSGPPGSEITVTGAGWPPAASIEVTGAVTGALPPGATADPYAATTTNDAGTFTVTFRLETTPGGGDLEVGRFELIVRAPANQVSVPFLVETRRPIQGGDRGG